MVQIKKEKLPNIKVKKQKINNKFEKINLRQNEDPSIIINDAENSATAALSEFSKKKQL